MDIKYYKHKLTNLIVVNNIVTIHYFEFNKDFVYPPEKHDFWELVYADKASVIVETDGKRFELKEGEIFFHKPGTVHTHSANGITAPNVFIISFVCKSQAIRFFEDKKLTLNKNFVKFIYLIAEEGKKTFNLPFFNPSLTKMELLSKPTLGGEQLIKNYLEIFLINVMRYETQKDNSNVIFLRETENSGNVTENVISFMKKNVDQRITIKDVCDAVNYNKSYVFREFKRKTDSTVMDYFNRLKIERAKQLLRENKLNVTQIAEKLNFDTPTYFTKTFRKFTGFSPLQYKKIYLSAEH